MERPRIRWRRSAAVALAGALVLASCTSTADPTNSTETPTTAGETRDGGDLSVALSADTSIIDPHLTGSSTTAILARHVVDSLVAQGEDMSFSPWLAEEWEQSDDNTEYVFHLRSGITFSDGTPLDADAVVYNFERILDPETNSPYARSLLGPVAEVEAVDELTVRITYETPFATLLQGLSLPYTGIESPTFLESGEASPTTLVGSGPFVLESFAPGSGTSLVRRDDYAWGPGFAENTGASHLDSLEFLILPEASVRLGALRSGQVQAIEAVPPSEVESLADDPDLDVLTYSNPGVTYSLFLNTSRPPFDDVRVRQAFQSSFDTAAVATAAYLGTMEPADNILAPSTPYYAPEVAELWGFDLDRANALLDEAGWTERDADGYRTKDGARLTVVYPFAESANQAEDLTLAQAVQAEAKAAGFDVQIDLIDEGTITERMGAADYDIFSFFFVRPEADILRTVFHSSSVPPNGANVSFMSSVDDQLATAVGAPDEERTELYRQVQEAIIVEAYAVPLYVNAFLLGVSSDLHDVSWATNAKPIFYDAWLE